MRTVLFPLCGLLVLVSCSGPSPRQAAEGYLGALSRLDFEGAAGYVVAERRSDFQDLRRLYSTLPATEQEKFRIVGWEVDSVAVTGTTASVEFTFDHDRRGELALTLMDGAWKVVHRSF